MPIDVGRAGIVSLVGAPTPYALALALQRAAHEARLGNRIGDTVYLLEHAPVVTIGRSAHGSEHILTSRSRLAERGIEVIDSDRGGDVTYHAPGQLVAYPIVDLACTGRDLHRYLRALELAVIDALAALGLDSAAVPGRTGVWTARGKIAAIGVRVARWVGMHGLAINRDLDLSPMRSDIVPCGIAGHGVTSLAEEGLHVSRALLESTLARGLSRRLGLEISHGIDTSSIESETDLLRGIDGTRNYGSNCAVGATI